MRWPWVSRKKAEQREAELRAALTHAVGEASHLSRRCDDLRRQRTGLQERLADWQQRCDRLSETNKQLWTAHPGLLPPALTMPPFRTVCSEDSVTDDAMRSCTVTVYPATIHNSYRLQKGESWSMPGLVDAFARETAQMWALHIEKNIADAFRVALVKLDREIHLLG